MFQSKKPRTGYELVARQQGDRLTLTTALRDEMRGLYLQRIATIEKRRWRERDDRGAFDQSVEWERLGDFLARTGTLPGAMKAYREAALCCIDSVPYDYGHVSLPCRGLRLRLRTLVEKALAQAGNDRRLRSLLTDDPLIRSEMMF